MMFGALDGADRSLPPPGEACEFRPEVQSCSERVAQLMGRCTKCGGNARMMMSMRDSCIAEDNRAASRALLGSLRGSNDATAAEHAEMRRVTVTTANELAGYRPSIGKLIPSHQRNCASWFARAT